ncbi:Nsp1-like C-terminal region-domain-containing protein [Melampsora americana]|nr:Nsp1-like C-terminal region-domain-containing protein [Melampsora americana]
MEYANTARVKLTKRAFGQVILRFSFISIEFIDNLQSNQQRQQQPLHSKHKMANPFGGDQSKTSNLFGNSNTTQNKSLFSSATTPNLFGTSTNTAGSTTPQTSPTKPSNLLGTSSTSTSLFGTPSNTAPTSSTPPTFAFPPTNVTQNQQSSTTTAPSTNTPSLFGATPGASGQTGGLLGAKSSTSSAPTSTSLFGTPGTASSSSNSLFAGQASQQPPQATAATGSSGTAQSNDPKAPLSAPPAGGLFGAKAASTLPAKPSPLASKDSSSVESSSTPALNLKSSTATAQTPTKASVGLSAPSLLRGKTMEDLVSRWTAELNERTADFKHMADEIAAWDQVLIQNGDQISNLYSELQRIEPIQTSIDQTLDHVETQQAELSAALDDYERQLSTHLPPTQDLAALPGQRARTAAQEREQAYKLAEDVHGQLNDMATSLGAMISELNTLSGPRSVSTTEESGALAGTPTEEDPIAQVAGILNAHLTSLNWVGEITQDLGSKLGELERRVTNTKVEFGLENRQQDGGGGLDDHLPSSTISNPYHTAPRR